MLRCQLCERDAVVHVTLIEGGAPHEYHVCEEHARHPNVLRDIRPVSTPGSILLDKDFQRAVREATSDPAASERMCEYLGPPLVRALRDDAPHVRVQAAQMVMMLALTRLAKWAVPALIDALHDPDAHVRTVAGAVLRWTDPDAAARAGVQ